MLTSGSITKSCLTQYIVIHSILQGMNIPPAALESTEKWEAQLRKGCLELAVLASLWEAPLYGLEILRVLERESQLVVSEGTVYPILNRLRAEGLLDSRWVEAEAGHPRKYYSLTQDGRERAILMTRTWESFSSSIQKLIKPLTGKRRA